MKTALDTLSVSTLVLRPEHPDSERVISNPAAAHGQIARCTSSGVSDPGRTLYWVAPATSDGKPVVVVQTAERVDWSPLRRDLLIERDRTVDMDLSEFEVGSQVKLEVLATATRHRSNNMWNGHPVTDPQARARYAKFLGLDPENVTDLSRTGLVWKWKFKDGSEGTLDEGRQSWEQPIIDDEACVQWFMKNAFAVRGADGKSTGETSVEFMSCVVTQRRVIPLKRPANKNLRLAARGYSAVVAVTNTDAFRDRIACGVGRYKSHGLGLVRVSLV